MDEDPSKCFAHLVHVLRFFICQFQAVVRLLVLRLAMHAKLPHIATKRKSPGTGESCTVSIMSDSFKEEPSAKAKGSRGKCLLSELVLEQSSYGLKISSHYINFCVSTVSSKAQPYLGNLVGLNSSLHYLSIRLIGD